MLPTCCVRENVLPSPCEVTRPSVDAATESVAHSTHGFISLFLLCATCSSNEVWFQVWYYIKLGVLYLHESSDIWQRHLPFNSRHNIKWKLLFMFNNLIKYVKLLLKVVFIIPIMIHVNEQRKAHKVLFSRITLLYIAWRRNLI